MPRQIAIEPAFFTSLIAFMWLAWPFASPEPSARMPSVVPKSAASTSCTPTAFPVMTAAVGLPVLVQRFGGDPAVVCAIGMLSGFCGTLMTPMAANFNIVPVALLELPDEKSVIRVQVPTALILLVINTILIYVLAFR